jgi:hypothetical protein
VDDVPEDRPVRHRRTPAGLRPSARREIRLALLRVRAKDPRHRLGTPFRHARKSAEVMLGADTYQITVEPGITITAPRTTSRDIRRHKASNYLPPVT